MTDSASTKTNNALQPMELHLLANIHNVAASAHFQEMRVSNVGAFRGLSASTKADPAGAADYQNLFGNLDHCECAECRSVFGPAAYFVDLMRTVDEEISPKNNKSTSEAFKLKTRRSDLFEIPLTCEKTNKLVSYLDIVNEVLARHVAPASLEQQAKTDLAVIYGTFKAGDAEKAKKAEEAVAREILGLSLEEYNLLIDSKSNDNLLQIYGVTGIKELNKLDVFCEKIGLSEQEVHELFPDKANDQNIKNHQLYINAELKLGTYHKIETRTITNLTDSSLDRIHRFVRLARKLNWSFADLDWVLQSITPTGQPKKINDSAIITIAKIKQLQKRLILDIAYKTLATKKIFTGLPFNRPLEQIRACLRQEKTDLATLYKLFEAPELAIAREILGLSVEEYKLLVTPQDNKKLVETYGTTDASKLVDDLTKLDVFCQKTGLSEQELHELFLDKLKDINNHALFINKDLGGQYHKSSHPREPPPQVLTDPDLNVSAHPAPIVQPLHTALSNEQTGSAVSALCDSTTVLLAFYDAVGVCIFASPNSLSAAQDISRSDRGLTCNSDCSS